MIPNSALASRAAFESYCRTFAGGDWQDGQQWANILGRYAVRHFPEDTAICPHLITGGFWEAWISLAIARAIRPDDHVLDVGSNVGYYTMLACDRVGREGKVVAVEANSDMAVATMQAIRRNGLMDVAHVVRAAAWDVGGRDLTLFAPPSSISNGSVARNKWGDMPVVVQTVRTATIDDIVRDTLGGRVDLIKIDIEGAEQKAWLGMQRTLDDNPDVVLVLEVATGRYPETAMRFYQEIAKRFWLRWCGYDGSPVPVTVEELLARETDWMLWLTRRGET